MSENLIIKIGSDIGEAVDGLHELGNDADQLNERFSNLTKIAAAGFAVFTGSIALSVVKFGEADQASRKLGEALQAQGIYTDDLKEKYIGYAEAVSAATGIEAKDIEQAQATIQTYLGEREVTQELTEAIANYAVAKGITLVEAANKLGKAIDGNAQRMAAEGLVVNKNMTEEERYGAVLDFVTTKYGEQAEVANQGLGGIKGLQAAFNSLAEEIGSRFAPVIGAVIEGLTHVFQVIKDNPALVEFIVAFLAAGTAITGVITFIGALIPIIGALTSGVAVLGLTFNVAFVGIPLLIGAVVAAAVYLAANWDAVSGRIIAITNALVNFISEAFGGIGKILTSVFHFDLAGIEAGMSQVKAALVKGTEAAWADVKTTTDKAEVVQDAGQKDYATKVQNTKKLQNIEQHKQEETFRQDILALGLVYDAKDQSDRTENENKKLESLRASIKTERDAEVDEENRKLKFRIDADNKQLAEQQRYGAVSAAISKILHSEEIQSANTAAGELVGLANSKNAELKAIGQAATVVQIGIKTAEGAVSVYNAFLSTIPFPPVAIPLAVGAAAAVVAYGAEQIGNVLGLADGGLLEGGIPGKDSIPLMGQAGELMVPRRNFDEVVGAVAAKRSGQDPAAAVTGGGAPAGGQHTTVHIHGDLIGDNAHVDQMIRKINDAVLYRNAQVLTRPGGVTGR